MRTFLAPAAFAIVLAACGSPTEPASATKPATPESPSAPSSADPPDPPVTSPDPASAPEPAAFAPAPAVGWVARANCHMGACTWNRYEEVQRDGDDAAPRYRLRLTQGESKHPGDYPLSPEGVEIAWDAVGKPAEVRCSRTMPQASIDAYSGALSLNPRGVPGAMQALANLYFATCHGEYGDDAALAKKYGYAVG